MSYDYSSEGKRLELPNPYRVQNQLLAVCSVLLIIGALFCLWKGRQAWLENEAITGLIPVVIGIGLLLAGLTAASAVASRLLLFFGRGRPASLSFVTATGHTSVVREVALWQRRHWRRCHEHIKEMLKQGVLAYPNRKAHSTVCSTTGCRTSSPPPCACKPWRARTSSTSGPC